MTVNSFVAVGNVFFLRSCSLNIQLKGLYFDFKIMQPRNLNVFTKAIGII